MRESSPSFCKLGAPPCISHDANHRRDATVKKGDAPLLRHVAPCRDVRHLPHAAHCARMSHESRDVYQQLEKT